MRKLNWNEFGRGVFLVNCLAIVYDKKTKTILIGRREKDPLVRKLVWNFPGGRPGYTRELEDYLRLEVKKKTNLDVKIKKLIFARIPEENNRFLLLYYLAEPLNVGKEKAGEKFVEIRWIKPKDARKFFTTSLHPEISRLLKELA
jgi:ADP-ribose pyrophosphatase YjhB (NUDIX family)